MNKKDIILIITLLLIAGLVYFLFIRGKKGDGNQVLITVDGVKYGTYALNRNEEIEVNSEDGYNKVVIRDAEVFIQEADCPDRYCVKQGKISDKSESLICLPHELIVELEIADANMEEQEVDIITK